VKEPSDQVRVFVNYRRSDSGGYAGRLYDALVSQAGLEVFMDVDKIDYGVDFPEAIEDAIAACDVVIALIGPQWLTASGADGSRRLDDPADFVRIELEAALRRHTRIIPALVQGTEMPPAAALPESLSPLARRNALELSDARWRHDMQRLLDVLERTKESKRSESTPPTPPAEEPSRRRRVAPSRAVLAIRRRPLVAAIALLVLLVALAGGIAAALMSSDGAKPPPAAIGDIPAGYLADYDRAALRFGLDWAVLAAIGKLTCDHGRSQVRGCNPPRTVDRSGSTGPMQFLGSTWRTGTAAMTVPPAGPAAPRGEGYATDGDGDGVADVWKPADAIAGAARFLQANGAPANYRGAILDYRDSQAFLADVLAQAADYRRLRSG
jgi:hypothetical protein